MEVIDLILPVILFKFINDKPISVTARSFYLVKFELQCLLLCLLKVILPHLMCIEFCLIVFACF